MVRKIIHIDMDAFYTSIEQRDNPKLRGKPIAVGYAGERGVVAAASYEARKFGVYSAMSSKSALAKCPHIIFVQGRHDVYKAVSMQMMKILYDYTDLIEPLSLDEAFLDVTQNKVNIASATIIASDIKKRISTATGLTASAGVSINKFLAKIASDYKKPDGLFVITDTEAEKFIEDLKIEKFWGVGKVTAEKMRRLGIFTGADLKRFSENELLHYFGKAGSVFYMNVRANDNRSVISDRIHKSMGAENTFSVDVDDRIELKYRLKNIVDEVWLRISKYEFQGRTVILKVKYSDFVQTTRSKTFNFFVDEYEFLWKTAKDLLQAIDLYKKVRLLGLSVANTNCIEQSKTHQLKIEFKEYE